MKRHHSPSAFFVLCVFLDVEVGVCLALLLLGGCVGVCFLCFGFVLVCVLVVQVGTRTGIAWLFVALQKQGFARKFER